MSKRYLYFTACAIWGIPGIIITAKGIYSYTRVSEEQLWWLLTITASVLAGFMFMFRNIVCKYSERIESLEKTKSLWQAFPRRGWYLIAFMTVLGITLKAIGMPAEFTSSFYCGLGPSLVASAVLFVRNSYNGKPSVAPK